MSTDPSELYQNNYKEAFIRTYNVKSSIFPLQDTRKRHCRQIL